MFTHSKKIFDIINFHLLCEILEKIYIDLLLGFTRRKSYVLTCQEHTSKHFIVGMHILVSKYLNPTTI